MSKQAKDMGVGPEADPKVAPEAAPERTPLDPSVADALGDEILLSAAGSTTVQHVSGTSASSWSAVQSHSARAWSKGGKVD